jgi:hypothetical protein
MMRWAGFAAMMCSAIMCSAKTVGKRIEIQAGVFMPVVNMGGVFGSTSNFTAFLALGGRGVGSSWDDGTPMLTDLSNAIAKSHIPRSELFITSKVRCCENGGTPGQIYTHPLIAYSL